TGARAGAARTAPGRAAVQPRSGAARAHPARAADTHHARGDHERVRHPRAGRSVRLGRPGGRAARRTARADGHARRAVRAAGGRGRGAGGRAGVPRGDGRDDVRRGGRALMSARGGWFARAALTLLLAWLALYPILIVVVDAGRGGALATFVSRPGEWGALWASVWISLASVALAAAIGVPLAFLFEWLEFPG